MKWLELKLDTSPAGLDPVSQLLEEQGICQAQGFHGIAAGARAVAGPAFPKMVEGLEGRLLAPRREPELYYGR